MQYTYAKFCRKAPTVQGLFVPGFLWFLYYFWVEWIGMDSGSVEMNWAK